MLGINVWGRQFSAREGSMSDWEVGAFTPVLYPAFSDPPPAINRDKWRPNFVTRVALPIGSFRR